MNSHSGSSPAHDREAKPSVEVLPLRDDVREHLIELADILAKVLDTTVRIPGTSLYLGLDPLLGLIPGIGDALANLLGTIMLGLATRLRVPRIVLARMSLNLLINGAVGAVPIAGDLFSVWFRSHARNAVLLREAATRLDRETRLDWFYVGGIIGGTAVLLLLAIAFVVWLVVKVWSMIAL
ncbi:MAG: hypothetical protein EWM72_03191 [Nitrospira sp.]|nr:MAG: hypothetical protein EWM72_03191 [Nitrospira sp.]